MEIHKQTPFLIDRLKTAEIDNIEELKDYMINDLIDKRYWNDVKFDTALMMCACLTMNGKKITLYEFQNFFKN